MLEEKAKQLKSEYDIMKKERKKSRKEKHTLDSSLNVLGEVASVSCNATDSNVVKELSMPIDIKVS